METRLRRENNGLAADEPGKSAATNGSKDDPNVIAAERIELAEDHPLRDTTGTAARDGAT